MDTSRRCNQGRVGACRSGYVAGKGVGHSCRRPLYHPVLTKPRPAFRAVFQVAITRADSGVILIKEPPDPSKKAPSPDMVVWIGRSYPSSRPVRSPYTDSCRRLVMSAIPMMQHVTMSIARAYWVAAGTGRKATATARALQSPSWADMARMQGDPAGPRPPPSASPG